MLYIYAFMAYLPQLKLAMIDTNRRLDKPHK